MIQDSEFEPTGTMQDQADLVSGSVSVSMAASEAALASEPRNPDRLSTLPQEMLLEIFHVLPTFKDKGCFVLTSKYLHQISNKYLYRSTGETLSWLPVFLAARQGDIAQLNKCKEAGAPANISWNDQHSSRACVSPDIRHGGSPLEEAIMNLQVRTVKWFLKQGTSPNREKSNCSPLMRAFWMLRKYTIAGHPVDQRRTHRNRYSTFAMDKLGVQAEKARRIIDLLRDAGADLSRKEAANFDDHLKDIIWRRAWEFKRDDKWVDEPSKAAWVTSFDPNSVAMSDWLGIAQVLGFPR
ncbi:hypothetical protein CEP54_012646 [Fusarium duplospermum]|uniref:F-box domain-containing protein n=1 Tax=Fusarium duplospermum TaxID=1325734 RepID=A0A428P7K4_9HYPO|nr:hypothetical protein CEP54_012646 [Fusarium duplospermum]